MCPTFTVTAPMHSPGRLRKFWVHCSRSNLPVAYLYNAGIGQKIPSNPSRRFPGKNTTFGISRTRPAPPDVVVCPFHNPEGKEQACEQSSAAAAAGSTTIVRKQRNRARPPRHGGVPCQAGLGHHQAGQRQQRQ